MKTTRAFVIVLGLLAATGLGTASAAPGISVTVKGAYTPSTIPGPLEFGAGSASGTFDLQRFDLQSGSLFISVGTLSVVLTNSFGNIRQVLLQDTVLPVAISSNNDCTAFTIEVGPVVIDRGGIMLMLGNTPYMIHVPQGDVLSTLFCDITSSTKATEIIRLLNKLVRAIS